MNDPESCCLQFGKNMKAVRKGNHTPRVRSLDDLLDVKIKIGGGICKDLDVSKGSSFSPAFLQMSFNSRTYHLVRSASGTKRVFFTMAS